MQDLLEIRYALPDLVGIIQDDSLMLWKQEHARGMTLTQARETFIRAIETQVRELETGIVHVSVSIEASRRTKSEQYYWRCLRRQRGVYVVDPRSIPST